MQAFRQVAGRPALVSMFITKNKVNLLRKSVIFVYLNIQIKAISSAHRMERERVYDYTSNLYEILAKIELHCVTFF